MIQSLKKLYKLVKFCDKTFFIYALVAFFISVTAVLVQMMLPKFVVDYILSDKTHYAVVLIGVVVFFLTLVLKEMAEQVLSNRRKLLNKKCEQLIADKAMHVPYYSLEDETFMALKSGAVYAVRQYHTLENAVKGIYDVLLALTIVSISVGYLMWHHVSLLLIIVLGVAIQLYCSKNLNEKLGVYFRNLFKLNRKYDWFSSLKHNLSVQKDARIFQMNGHITDKMKVYNKETADIFLEMNDITAKNDWIVSCVNVGILGLGYLITGLKALSGHLTMGMFVFLNILVSKISGLMLELGTHLTSLSQLLDYLSPVFDVLSLDAYDTWGTETLKSIDTIEFKNVSFKYPNSSEWTVENLTFKINPKERIGLVGLNGAGKTTVIKLITGLYAPTNGNILINGKGIKQYSYQAISNQMGSVFQDFALFNMSISENIVAGESYGEDRFQKVSEAFKLNDLFDQYEDGKDTSLGTHLHSKGVELSGGQQQKLATARAFYKEATLLLFDEPTSKLDPITEFETYQLYNQAVQEKMAIFISHRMATTRFCDRILVLDKGKMQDFDTHENLMNKEDSLYKHLFETQKLQYDF